MKRILDFGSWPSPLGAADIARGARRFSQPQWDRGFVHWLEARPSEAGRQVVMRARPGEACLELSPPGRNIRTRVHEYGGGDYRVADGELFSVSFDDQVLYRGRRPLTSRGPRYANMARSPDGNWLVAVEEISREGAEAENRLVAFSLEEDSPQPRVVAAGHDFFSSPCFAPDGATLAFIAWDHPDMPWDATRLYCVAWGEHGVEGTARCVAGGPGESLVQPRYSPSGWLTFVSDRTGFWNLYQRNEAGEVALCPRQAEFGQPHWVFGIQKLRFYRCGSYPMQLPRTRR